MRKPSILGGIVFALLAALLAVPVWWGIRLLLPFEAALRTLMLAVHLAYLAYLIRSSRSRVGGLTLAVVNLALGAATFAIAPSPGTMVIVLLTALSGSRTLIFHRRVTSLVLDGALVFAGVLFAGYVNGGSDSVFVAIWSFLAVQSLFPLLGRLGSSISGKGKDRSHASPDPFHRSHRQAESALRRIIEGAG